MGGIYFEHPRSASSAADYDVFRRRIRVPRPQRAVIALRIWARSWHASESMQPIGLEALSPRAACVHALSDPTSSSSARGFAGLSAATALAERGVRVLVLEARPTLGGRATAFTDPATGERVDNGQHVLFGCYHETFTLSAPAGHRRTTCDVQPDLHVDVIDRARPRVAPALPAAAARRCICSPESSRWDAHRLARSPCGAASHVRE